MAKPIDQIKWQELAIGGVVIESGSCREYETGTWRTEKPIVDHDACVQCGTCWLFCPEASIEKLEDGRFQAELTYCKGCGICAAECPVECITMVPEEEE